MLAVFAYLVVRTLRRPDALSESPVALAVAAAIAVSLVVNDSPTDVPSSVSRVMWPPTWVCFSRDGPLLRAPCRRPCARRCRGCGGEEESSPAPETVEGTVPTDGGGGGGGGGGEGDAAAGKEVYASAGCGSCHTFADAGTSGTVGPNLDESSVDVAAAEEQIRAGGGGMPAFEGQLSDEEIANVAAYVVETRG